MPTTAVRSAYRRSALWLSRPFRRAQPEANGNIGFKLGEGGFINFAATLRQNRAALRSIPATGAF
jgi:hypothetical protein